MAAPAISPNNNRCQCQPVALPVSLAEGFSNNLLIGGDLSFFVHDGSITCPPGEANVRLAMSAMCFET
jgi:hypothetical protein